MSRTSDRPHVAIIGAGIGGLTAALALLERGFDVDVYERARDLAEIGAGLHLTPNGTRVLYDLGLRDAVDRVAVNQSDREVCLWDTGQAWKLPHHGATASARFGAPYLLMHRGDLHSLLVAAVRARKPDAIHTGACCTHVTQDGAGVDLSFEDGRSARADVCVGADGFHSVVRRLLFGADRPVFTGYLAWRGLIPIDRVPDRISRFASAWMGPNGQITLYPVRRNELLNFIGVAARDDWRVESWTVEGTVEECASDFRGWHPAIQELIARMRTPHKWALFSREPLPEWTRGRITLLGDAAHSMLPYLGQGGNIAIEDGPVLARCLEEGGDIEAALCRYEVARRPRATAVIYETLEQWRRVRHPDIADPEKAPLYVEREWDPAKVKGRYDWIFDYDANRAPI